MNSGRPGDRPDGASTIAVRLGGFLLLIAVIFLIAYLLGAHIGPVSPVHGRGGAGGMTMSTVLSGTAPGSEGVR